MIAISEETVRASADICGPYSAAAKALKNAEERRARGEEVRFYRYRGALLVHGTSEDAALVRKEGETK